MIRHGEPHHQQRSDGTPADPFPSGPLGKVTLAAFFTAHALANRADFRSADIELYPGTIDRLW